MSRVRKNDIFDTVITSKLLYGLAGAWLNTAERRRLDGFQNRCLRPIWGIAPAYFSRVSNADVLLKSGAKPLSKALIKQQLLLFGKVAREPEESPLRKSVFQGNTLDPVLGRYVRRKGRPRLEWTSEVFKLAVQAAGDYSKLCKSVQSSTDWKSIVGAFIV